MKYIFFTTMVLIGLIVSSFQNNPQDSTRSKAPSPTTNPSVKELALSNTYLNLDMDKFLKEKVHSVADENISKAALYRSYKHVSLMGGYYVCDLKNEKEINVSKSIYKTFLKNINDINTTVKKARAKGRHMDLQPVNKAYINSLVH